MSSQLDRTRLVNNAYSLQHRHIFVRTGFMSKNDWAIRVVIKLSCAKRMDSKSLVLLIFSKSWLYWASSTSTCFNETKKINYFTKKEFDG